MLIMYGSGMIFVGIRRGSTWCDISDTKKERVYVRYEIHAWF
jgi:hypothetical protein